MKTTVAARLASRLVSVLALGVAAVALAGPLTPPPGAVAPMGKTTDQLEPRTPLSQATTPGNTAAVLRITQPGSYYLTEDLFVDGNRVGIQVEAPVVTIDLNGFRVIANAGTVGINASTIAVHVKNGLIAGFGSNGVSLLGQGCSVENITSRDNNGAGIVTGTESSILSCVATQNLGDGIFVGNGSRIEGCIASGNVVDGIDTSNDCVVTDCTLTSNFSDGIEAGFNNVIERCSASSNTANGIATGSTCVVTACSTSLNGASGVSAGSGSVVRDCASRQDLTGFTAFAQSTIESCSAQSPTEYGIIGSSSCTIRNNRIIGADIAGIRVLNDNLIIGNHCENNNVTANTAIGIEIRSSDNRVEGNTLVDNDIGLDVSQVGNLIIKNAAAGNIINYSIRAGNTVASIIQPATNNANIEDTTYSGNVGLNDPWANFIY